MRPCSLAVTAVLALFTLSACTEQADGGGGAGGAPTGGSGGGSDPPEVEAAIASCYATLQGATEQRDAALESLQAATELYPENGRAHLFLGMCSLAALAEDGDVAALAAIEPALERAIELLPDDRRIPGWLATVRVQTARILGDEAELQAAVDEMIAAADLYPEFNNVSLAIAFAGLPLDTPYPAMAVERLRAIEDCGEVDDRCRDNDAAPHNVPGSLMLFGDVHARVGDARTAGAYYAQAIAAPSSAGWKYSAAAQAALDGVDERAASWSDTDAGNDPAFFLSGAATCTGCHE